VIIDNSKHHKQARASSFIFFVPHGHDHHCHCAAVVLSLHSRPATTSHSNHQAIFPSPRQLPYSRALLLPLLYLTASLAATCCHLRPPPAATPNYKNLSSQLW